MENQNKKKQQSVQKKGNKWNEFWRKIWEYISENWIHWLTFGLSKIIEKLKEWSAKTEKNSKEKKEIMTKEKEKGEKD